MCVREERPQLHVPRVGRAGMGGREGEGVWRECGDPSGLLRGEAEREGEIGCFAASTPRGALSVFHRIVSRQVAI
jgi:hypothetical protein